MEECINFVDINLSVTWHHLLVNAPLHITTSLDGRMEETHQETPLAQESDDRCSCMDESLMSNESFLEHCKDEDYSLEDVFDFQEYVWLQDIVSHMYHHFNDSWKDGMVFLTCLFLETFDHIFNCEISSSAIDVCVQSLSIVIYELIYELSSFDMGAMSQLQGQILQKCHGTHCL